MMKLHEFIRGLILQVVDAFYPVFKSIMPLQTFRYAACGGFNTLLDISLFYCSFHFLLHEQPVHFSGITISGHIAAFIISFCFTFPVGFYLSRYVVFQQTDVAKHIQAGKYFTVVFMCVLLNYAFLKLMVDYWGWYPTPSKIVTTFFVVTFSYLSQKNFTFKAPADKG
jgi:putative flippase GtrA